MTQKTTELYKNNTVICVVGARRRVRPLTTNAQLNNVNSETHFVKVSVSVMGHFHSKDFSSITSHYITALLWWKF